MRRGDSLGEKVDVFFELGIDSETRDLTEGDYFTTSFELFTLLGLTFLAVGLTFVGEYFFLVYIWLILDEAVCSRWCDFYYYYFFESVLMLCFVLRSGLRVRLRPGLRLGLRLGERPGEWSLERLGLRPGLRVVRLATFGDLVFSGDRLGNGGSSEGRF